MLAAHYPEILRLHIACVIASGSLFAARSILRIADRPLANARALRMLSYAIDSTLLVAAILLTVILRQYPIEDDWLTTKVVLLVVYIALGTVALKRARTRIGRGAAFAGAMLVFGWIIGVAVTHHPAGWLLWLRASS